MSESRDGKGVSVSSRVEDVGLIAEPTGTVPVEIQLTPPAIEPPRFSQRLLNVGFATGILLAIFCLGIASWYLISYLRFGTGALGGTGSSAAPDPASLMANMYMARVLLQSCGLAVGMAFGFLGFSLFLLGVGGTMDASASAPGGLGIQVARISPGAFVMLCSAILVGLCATRDVRATMGGTTDAVASGSESERLNVLAGDGADEGETGARDIPIDQDSAAADGNASGAQ